MKPFATLALTLSLLAGCGGDPFWFLPPPGELTGALVIGEGPSAGCANLVTRDDRWYDLVLPAGWRVGDQLSQAPEAGTLVIFNGQRIRVTGSGTDERQSAACPGRPYLVSTVAVESPDTSP